MPVYIHLKYISPGCFHSQKFFSLYFHPIFRNYSFVQCFCFYFSTASFKIPPSNYISIFSTYSVYHFFLYVKYFIHYENYFYLYDKPNGKHNTYSYKFFVTYNVLFSLFCSERRPPHRFIPFKSIEFPLSCLLLKILKNIQDAKIDIDRFIFFCIYTVA